MTKGRKPIADALIVDVPSSVAVVTAENLSAANALAETDQKALNNTNALASHLGYSGPIEPKALEFIVVERLGRSLESLLQAGQALLLLKERLPHGQWIPCLRRMAVPQHFAQRLMNQYSKFSDRGAPLHVARAAGNTTKLIELLALGEDEFKELSEQGSVLGITMDDVSRMSGTELRHALREARFDIAAKEDLITARNQTIDDLDTKLAKKKYKLSDESLARIDAEEARMKELTRVTRKAELAIEYLTATTMEMLNDESTQAFLERVNDAYQYLFKRLCVPIDHHRIDVDINRVTGVQPEWLNGVRDDSDDPAHG